MLKNSCAFIGLGQCGNNLASTMEKEYNYNCLLINSSKEDLEAVNSAHMFHLEGGEGLAKEPAKIVDLMQKNDNAKKMCDTIDNQIKDNEKYVFVEFSSGGGTGNALSGMICKYLIGKNKVVCPVVVIPNEEEESVVSSKNTFDCLKKLETLDGIGATFILDNKRVANKFSINKEFSNVLNAFLTRENKTEKGNMDDSEYGKLLKQKGYIIITKTSRDNSTNLKVLSSVSENFYAPLANNPLPKYFSLSICNGKEKNVDKKSIMDNIGMFFMDDFVGYGGNSTLLIISGMNFPIERIKLFRNKISEKKEDIIAINNRRSVFEEIEDDDLDDLFSDKPAIKKAPVHENEKVDNSFDYLKGLMDFS